MTRHASNCGTLLRTIVLITIGFNLAARGAAPTTATASQADYDARQLALRLWDNDAPAAEQVRACDTLKEMGPQAAPAAEALVYVLARGGPVRRHARDALVQIGRAAVPALRTGLNHTNHLVRVECAEALSDLGPDAAAATEDVLQLLRNEDAESRQLAAMIAEGIGPAAKDAIAPMAKAITTTDGDSLSMLLHALRAVDPEAPPDLYRSVANLHDAYPDRRMKAIAKLAQIGQRAAVAMPALTDLLSAPNPQVRAAAADALDTIGEPGREGVDALIAAARKYPEDESVRKVMTRVLSKGGPATKEALSRLVEMLREEVFSDAAQEVLLKLGPDANGAANDLKRLLRDGNEEQRRRAAVVLGAIHAAPDALALAVYDSSSLVADAAAESLVQLGAAAKPAAPNVLWALLHHRVSPAAGLRALRAAGRPADDIEPVLLDQLKSSDVAGRQEAATTLAAFYPDSRAAADALVDAVKQKDWAVRENLGPGLAKSPLKLTLLKTALEKLASEDSDELVRVNARCALRDLGLSVPERSNPPSAP